MPSSGITQASFTPPVSLSPQNQSKHAISTSSNNNPISSSADPHSQLVTVASDSEIRAAPSLSRSTSSLTSAPIAPKASREVGKEGETLPRPIPPPKSLQFVGQPSSATALLASQKRPTGSLRDTGDDIFSRPPDDRHHGETPATSVVQADSPREAAENKLRAESSDRVGLVQSFGTSSFVTLIDFDTCPLSSYLTARTAPSIVKVSSNTKEANMKEEYRTHAQSRHSISQLQHARRESWPNEQHHHVVCGSALMDHICKTVPTWSDEVNRQHVPLPPESLRTPLSGLSSPSLGVSVKARGVSISQLSKSSFSICPIQFFSSSSLIVSYPALRHFRMSPRNEEHIYSVYPSASTNVDQPVSEYQYLWNWTSYLIHTSHPDHLQGRGSSTYIPPTEMVPPVTIIGVDQHVREYWYLLNLTCVVIHRSGLSVFLSHSSSIRTNLRTN